MQLGIVWIAVIAISGLLAWAIALGVSIKAKDLNLVQSPNSRSSHTNPTPSGGGIGIAIAGSLGGVVLAVGSNATTLTILLTAAAIALLGFMDDLHDLSSRLRFGLQTVLVTALVLMIGPMPQVVVFSIALPNIAVLVLLIIAGVWWINLFNFMDGIDGIAASEGIFLLVGACGLWLLAGPSATSDPVWWWGLCVAGACAGFLSINWPPARIFMGDAGSNYIAMLVLGVAFYTISRGWLSYPSWLILSALFTTDATLTLCRRIASGQRWLSAHRTHAYQRLARRWGSHRRVTLAFVCINLLWLFPLAWCSLHVKQGEWWLVLLAYLPIVGVGVAAGAGKTGD